MKGFNIVFAILCIISAALQYNDPDPYVWATIYLACGAVLIYSVFRPAPRAAILTLLFVYLVYAVYLFFTADGVLDWAQHHDAESLTQKMQAEAPWIEQTREFFGLCLLIGALVLNLLSRRSTIGRASGSKSPA